MLADMATAENGEGANGPHIIYLTGQMRSGTTMLADLLDAQDDVRLEADHMRISGSMRHAFGGIPDPYRVLAEGAQLKFFLAFLKGLAVGPNGPARISRFSEYLTPEAAERCGGFTKADIAKMPKFGSVAKFYCTNILAQRPDGVRYIGNKETRAERVAFALARKNDVRAIIILRDPRDSTLSYLRKNEEGRFGGANDLETVISLWREGFEVWRRANGRTMLGLRYEDLVTDRAATLKRISQFLGIPIEDRDLKVHNSSFGDVSKGSISSAPVGRWREQADHEAIRKVGSDLAEEIAVAGYEQHTQAA